MHLNKPDTLESRLAALTEPTDQPVTLWRAALDQHRAPPAKRLTLRRVAPWAGLAAAILIATPLILSSLTSPRVARIPSASAPPNQAATGQLSDDPELDSVFADSRSASNFINPPASVSVRRRASPLEESARAAAPENRLIARKADISLHVPDVREAFLKAGALINPALGEFVTDSKIAGEGPAAAADLTLRVTADRLPAVLNDLRTLGVVTNEQSAGDDVTDQTIDLDARLRNERRVEQELIELLDSRQEAPLPDVLQLRESLTKVRVAIERLDAQRANLQRLVDLARILVIIRPRDATPHTPPDKGFLGDLREHGAIAWRDGSRHLARSLSTILERAVAHFPAWITLVIIGAVALRLGRRLARWSMLEPAPRC